MLRDQISPVITELRRQISSDWAKNDFVTSKKGGQFGNVENAMENADTVMPSGKKATDMTESEENEIIEKIVKSFKSDKSNEEEKQKEREERKARMKSKPITLNPVDYPASVLFEPKFLMGGKIVININVNHQFYQKFIVPLCGNLEEDIEVSNEKMMMRDAIFLLFCSYAKASSMYDDPVHEQLLEQHLSHIGTFLSTMTREYMGEMKNE